MDAKADMRAAYRVCKGRFFVNDEAIPLNRRVLRIGLAAAGLSADACGSISDTEARRILHMERAYLLSGLADALRSAGPEKAA